MAKVTMDQILEKQKEMTAKAMKLNDMEGEPVVVEANKLQTDSKQLRGMCDEFAAQEEKKWAEHYGTAESKSPKIVKVKLTDEQRKHVLDETGVRIEVVELEEGREIKEDGMPQENPALIEYKAMEKARGKIAAKEAAEENKKAISNTIGEIQAQKNPELNAQLDKTLSDPEFLGGMMEKK